MKNLAIIKFKIRNKENKSFCNVLIYDSLRDLRKDADAYDALDRDNNQPSNDDVLGLHHPYVREISKDDGKSWERCDDIGIIRLSKKHVNTEVACHECLHAAIWNYRVNYGGEDLVTGDHGIFNLGSNTDENEEKFCHIYGQMFRDLTRKLYKYQVWK